MSVATLTNNQNCPIILSDALITASDNKENVEIPVFLNSMPFLFNESQLSPESLRQKSFVINDHLAISMVGSIYEMKYFLADVRQFFKYYPTEPVYLQQFIDTFDKSSFSKSSCCFLIAYLINGRIAIQYSLVGTWEQGYSPVFGKIFSSGSGSKRIITEMESVHEYYTNIQNSYFFKNAVSLHCVMVCKLIASEFFSASNLKEYWGAAFELIGFDGNKFLKVDDVGFLIFDWKYDEQGNLSSSPRLAVDYKYYDEVLVLTVNNFVSIKRYGIIGFDQSVHDVDTSNIPNQYRFSSKKVACCYRVLFPNGNFKISAFFYEKLDETSEDLVSVKILPSGHSQVAIHFDFENQMMEDIRQSFEKGDF